MGSVVGLVRTQSSEEQIRDAISKALELIDFNAKNSVNSVAVKVNLCYYWHAATGYTTDPRVVAGVIDMLREIYGKDIGIKVVEADATAMKTNHVFLMLGYEINGCHNHYLRTKKHLWLYGFASKNCLSPLLK